MSESQETPKNEERSKRVVTMEGYMALNTLISRLNRHYSAKVLTERLAIIDTELRLIAACKTNMAEAEIKELGFTDELIDAVYVFLQKDRAKTLFWNENGETTVFMAIGREGGKPASDAFRSLAHLANDKKQ